MDFQSFIQGPLLWVVFSIFLSGIIIRSIFFLVSLLKTKKFENKNLNLANIFLSIGRLFLPLHVAFKKKPIYSILRYLYHICMIAVPVFLAGHIALWEVSSLNITWLGLPSSLADIMTLIFIALSIIFLARRIVLSKIHRRSSPFDFIFIIICILPFVTGYFLAHATLDKILFFANNLFQLHVITSCLMVIIAAFLFIKLRLDVKSCIGCDACEINCPTGTLEYVDVEKQRNFKYSHYQCIVCGSCIYSCPEDAAELRHEIGLKNIFSLQKQGIRSLELQECQKCGAFFAPEPLIGKVKEKISYDYLMYCPKCRLVNFAEIYRKRSPWTYRKT